MKPTKNSKIIHRHRREKMDADPGSDLNLMNEVIADFCADIIIEPLSYFSEADLHSNLFARLLDAFPDKPETSYSRGPGSKGKYRTGLVHREYGATGGRRTDISVFSREDIAAIDSPNLTIQGKYIRPRFAVELGTEKSRDTHSHVNNDLAKLARTTERGYLIYFYRDVTRSDYGTASRKRTEDKLKRIFRDPIVEARPDAHVNILCFVIRIARTGRTIRGKCEMLQTPSGDWKKVNLTRIRDNVYRLLIQRQRHDMEDQSRNRSEGLF